MNFACSALSELCNQQPSSRVDRGVGEQPFIMKIGSWRFSRCLSVLQSMEIRVGVEQRRALYAQPERDLYARARCTGAAMDHIYSMFQRISR